MKDVTKYMDFDVYTNLKDKSSQYNVTIDLENEVSSQAREAAIALSGAIVRNYHSNLYKDVRNDKDLAELIKEKLNQWIPEEENNKFIATSVNVGLKRVQGRAA